MGLNKLKDVKVQEIFPGFEGRMIHTEKTTIAYWNIRKDCILPRHSHVHEQTINVFEGKLQMTIGEETLTLEKGDVYVIAPNVPHAGVAVTDCYIMDVFSPVREDYRES